MSDETSKDATMKETTKDAGKESQSVQLFQRAHQKMVILQRVEEQLQQLLNQRRSIQDELRGIQVQINEEFDRMLRAGQGSAAMAAGRILSEMSEELRSPVAEAA